MIGKDLLSSLVNGTYQDPNSPMTVGQFNAYMKANPQALQLALPSTLDNPMKYINPMYTKAPAYDNSPSPMQMFLQAKQTGQIPNQANSFTPWQQPATPVYPVASVPVASSPASSGGK